jgi:DNA-binding response OmpR family regulator
MWQSSVPPLTDIPSSFLRVGAILFLSWSRMMSYEHQVHKFGPFLLDASECRLWREGQVIHLTPKAFELLRVMVKRSGRLLTKQELLQSV